MLTSVLVLFGSALGIAVMVALNARLGLSRPARLAGLDEALRRLDDDAVGFEPGEAVIGKEGRAALVENGETGGLALLLAHGSDFVIRYIGPGQVRAVRRDAEGELEIRLKDFSLPRVRIDLGDADVAEAWAGRLDKYKDAA
ncbi:hypothetical protein [Maricaulis sp. CAU 1757]